MNKEIMEILDSENKYHLREKVEKALSILNLNLIRHCEYEIVSKYNWSVYTSNNSYCLGEFNYLSEVIAWIVYKIN